MARASRPRPKSNFAAENRARLVHGAAWQLAQQRLEGDLLVGRDRFVFLGMHKVDWQLPNACARDVRVDGARQIMTLPLDIEEHVLLVPEVHAREVPELVSEQIEGLIVVAFELSGPEGLPPFVDMAVATLIRDRRAEQNAIAQRHEIVDKLLTGRRREMLGDLETYREVESAVERELSFKVGRGHTSGWNDEGVGIGPRPIDASNRRNAEARALSEPAAVAAAHIHDGLDREYSDQIL